MEEKSRIVVFENEIFFNRLIDEQLVNHVIVEKAYSLSGAFQILRKLAMKLIEADFIILDGSLDPEYPLPEFRFSPPDRDSEVIVVNPASHDSLPSRDAHTIVEVVRRCNMPQRIIGFSCESLTINGVQVDYDLTKDRVFELSETIENLARK